MQSKNLVHALKISCCFFFFCVPLLTVSPKYASAALVMKYDPNTFETFLVNSDVAPITIDGYDITSPSGLLDPVNWSSIADQKVDFASIIGKLGIGALSYGELSATSILLAESTGVSLADFATFQPNDPFSIGFPFGTSALSAQPAISDSTFTYLDLDVGSVPVTGTISAVPEPSLAYLAFMFVAGAAFLRWRQRKNLRD